MLSVLLSLAIHLMLLLVLSLLFYLIDTDTTPPGSYVEITTVKGNMSNIEKSDPEDEDINKEDESLTAVYEKDDGNVKPELPANKTYEVIAAGFDSTNLSQIYEESTLNVRLKYPSGWIYIDQQQKNKLDGVTFWAAAGDFDPPPYIHLEVVEKYIFIPEQYKYRYAFKNFEGYYNDPVELENQVTQIIYIRTEDDEDFTI